MEDFQGKEVEERVLLALDENRFGKSELQESSYYLPNPKKLEDFAYLCRDLLFPGYYEIDLEKGLNRKEKLAHLQEELASLLYYASCFDALCHCFEVEDLEEEKARKVAREQSLDFIQRLPSIQSALLLDLDAIFEGDPAANSKEEILLAYSTFFAILLHRIAHALHLNKIPLLPRMLSEFALRQTGIDIHPGASIGKSFCIDHGNGVVIGETAVIGDKVKIYQGVTLGALSLEDGRKLHGSKRHPTIEDEVTLYANATVLGGDTVIGQGATIGGNAFVTRSVQAGNTVYMKLEHKEKED